MNSVRHAVELIDRDRRGIANAGVQVATKLAGQAMRYAQQALRFGNDPVNALNAVLLGNNDTTHASAIEVLAQVMVVSNLKGRRRSIINASRNIEGVSLARTEPAQRKLTDEEKALLALLLLDDDEIIALQAEYGPIAQRLLEEATVGLVERVEGASGASIRDAFTSAGFSPDDPSELRNIFTTAGVRGYEDGRDRAWQEPVIREALWGFHYSAILDDRTTKLCTDLDGTVVPLGDPFIARFRPPNHFHCRSALVEVWRSSDLNPPPIIEPKASVYDMARYAADKQRFLSYF